jgi:copper chaperone CopZ
MSAITAHPQVETYFKGGLYMAAIQEVQLAVPDISCEHCAHAINGALNEHPRVGLVKTDIPTKTVQLCYDPNQISLQQVEAALDEIGYAVAK